MFWTDNFPKNIFSSIGLGYIEYKQYPVNNYNYHAYPNYPVNPKPDLTPPSQYTSELHDTATAAATSAAAADLRKNN